MKNSQKTPNSQVETAAEREKLTKLRDDLLEKKKLLNELDQLENLKSEKKQAQRSSSKKAQKSVST